jgi:hypothetical protein
MQIEVHPEIDYVFGCGSTTDATPATKGLFVAWDNTFPAASTRRNFVYSKTWSTLECVRLAIEPNHGLYLVAALQGGSIVIYNSMTGLVASHHPTGLATTADLIIDHFGYIIQLGHDATDVHVIKGDYEWADFDCGVGGASGEGAMVDVNKWEPFPLGIEYYEHRLKTAAVAEPVWTLANFTSIFNFQCYSYLGRAAPMDWVFTVGQVVNSLVSRTCEVNDHPDGDNKYTHNLYH